MAGTPVFTVGHSNRDLEEFINLLTGAGVAALVDVRRLPGSRKYPHFNDDVLAAELPAHGISYRRSEGLTGRRNVSRTVPFEVNGNWRNRSFHNYADHALGEEFVLALGELLDAAVHTPTVLMCSEAVWWRCHRRIIADHLLAAGRDVRHIMGPGKITPAELTAGGVVGEDGKVRYPAPEGA
ncbi:DUF488 domain-containing protein [Corynebacterium sp. YIM 101645]|uniref:DUF488 domain-containing protein n=1 Tax=Corynebacterium lemuris TaxID=1859292 RepID=A0ABT2FU95_9CORY|nr:DUF488 domain-containing protein [Corynebacterium lemuris]MCS5478800.1 DUF488 domain-containing protein [Corynebacterium lemuris]